MNHVAHFFIGGLLALLVTLQSTESFAKQPSNSAATQTFFSTH